MLTINEEYDLKLPKRFDSVGKSELFIVFLFVFFMFSLKIPSDFMFRKTIIFCSFVHLLFVLIVFFIQKIFVCVFDVELLTYKSITFKFYFAFQWKFG